MAKKTQKEINEETALAGNIIKKSLAEAIRQGELGHKEANRGRMRYEEFKANSEAPRESFNKAKMATERGFSHLQKSESELAGGAKDIGAIILMESLKPTDAGEGSDELPEDEKRKKSFANALKNRNKK